MSTDTMTIAAFIEAQGLTMTAEPAKNNPNTDADEWSKEASHWLCVIDCGGKKMPVPFSMGAGHRRWKSNRPALVHNLGFEHGATYADLHRLGFKPGEPCGHVRPKLAVDRWILEKATEPNPPNLADVLDCLASDAAGYDNAASFEDWCGEYGYDTDSRKAERTYRVIGEQAKRLRQLLGPRAYEQLLFQCERL